MEEDYHEDWGEDDPYEMEMKQRAEEIDSNTVRHADITESYENLNDLNLLLGGLDGAITEDLSKYKEQLKVQYPTEWAKAIIDLYGEKNLNANTIRIALEGSHLTQPQIETAARHFEKTHNQLGEKSLEIIKEKFQKILNGIKMNWAVNSSSDATDIIEKLSKNGAIIIGDGLDEFKNIIKEEDILKIDPETVKELPNSGIKSSIPWINDSFATGGWPKSSLILLTATPGSGKSLMALDQGLAALMQGYDVCYTCVGDLGPQDFLIRACSLLFNVRMNDVVNNIEVYMARLNHDYGERLKHLHTLFIDPGTVTMSQLAKYYKKKGLLNSNTVCIIDYDENIAPEKGSAQTDDMMYEKYKKMYQIAVSLTRGDNAFALLFMLGQPKTDSYNNQKLTMISAGTGSSHKVHAADIIIGFTREQCVNHQGFLSILKARRHGRPASVPYMLSFSGHIKVIDINTYESFKSQSTPMSPVEEEQNNNRIVEETKQLMLTNFQKQGVLE